MGRQKMKIVVLGANGRTGDQVIKLALKRGHNVTAVVRAQNKLPDFKHENLKWMVGDPCEPQFLASILPNQDALISTLGGRAPTKSSTAIYYRSAQSIVEATQEIDNLRVLVTSTALLFPQQSFMDRVIRFIARHNQNAAHQMEQILSNANVQYTFARCGFLSDVDESRYRAERNSLPVNGNSVSRKSVATFLLDSLENAETIGSNYGVSRPKE